MDRFAIINETTDPQITKELLLKGCAALQKQSERDFATAWKQTPSTVMLATNEDVQTADVHVTRIVDEIPEAPSALAYHSVDDQGRPILVIGWNAIKSEGGDIWASLWSAISHEICEERGNPFVNLNVDMPDGHHDTAQEVCDWTQGDLYVIDDHTMSNFVYPSFFCASSPRGTTFDHMSVILDPLTLRPGGYCELRNVKDGTSHMVFGKAVPAPLAHAKLAAHQENHSRLHRAGEPERDPVV